MQKIDLKKEQQNTLNRKPYNYSFMPRLLFFLMDNIAGKKNCLPKALLLEMLASIPYRAWEFKQYKKLTKFFRNLWVVKTKQDIVAWSRDAQDNEYWHLLVIHEKIKEDNIFEPWYVHPVITMMIVWTYRLFAALLACLSQRRAFLFNAEFEDHAEHIYAQMVADNPQWEQQPLTNEVVKKYADVSTWADVFRRISLDERDHRNNSFFFAEKKEHICQYEGMPEAGKK